MCTEIVGLYLHSLDTPFMGWCLGTGTTSAFAFTFLSCQPYRVFESLLADRHVEDVQLVVQCLFGRNPQLHTIYTFKNCDSAHWLPNCVYLCVPVSCFGVGRARLFDGIF